MGILLLFLLVSQFLTSVVNRLPWPSMVKMNREQRGMGPRSRQLWYPSTEEQISCRDMGSKITFPTNLKIVREAHHFLLPFTPFTLTGSLRFVGNPSSTIHKERSGLGILDFTPKDV